MTTSLAKKPPVLVAGVDDAYAMPCAVTLFSALSHLVSASAVEILILDGGVSSPNRDRLMRVLNLRPVEVRIEWVQADPRLLSDLPTMGYLSASAYLRLLIPDLLPTRDKVLWLDSDIIVQTDLMELWSTDIEGYAIAAVRDFGLGTLRRGLRNWREQGLDPDLPYFNSGVLLMNVHRWRAAGIGSTVIENLRRNQDSYRFADQDGLNAVLHSGWKELDPRWNYQTESKRIRHSPLPVDDVSVIHFCGADKPWSDHSVRRTTLASYRNRYFSYMRRCQWFGFDEYLRFRLSLALGVAKKLPGRTLARLGIT